MWLEQELSRVGFINLHTFDIWGQMCIIAHLSASLAFAQLGANTTALSPDVNPQVSQNIARCPPNQNSWI
jgi:hypothetical protein